MAKLEGSKRQTPSVSIRAHARRQRGSLDVFAVAVSRWPDDHGRLCVETTWLWEGNQVVPAAVALRSFQVETDKDDDNAQFSPLTRQPKKQVFDATTFGKPVQLDDAAMLPLRVSATELGAVPIAEVLRLHKIKIQEIATAVEKRHPEASEGVAGIWATELRSGAASLSAQSATHRSDGPDLRLVARVYEEACDMPRHELADGSTPRYRPAAWTLEQLSKRGGIYRASPATVRTWIKRARQAGFLPPTQPGRPYGDGIPMPTDRDGKDDA